MEIVTRKLDDIIPYKNKETKYVRERVCIECGKREMIRKDSPSVRCKQCSWKTGLKTARSVQADNKNKETCEQCGRLFYSPKSNYRKYCSMECFHEKIKGEKLQRTCKMCEKKFEIYASTLRTNASGNFCSWDCYSRWMCDAGYTKGRGSQWNKIKKETLKVMPVCTMCGTRSGLEVHHIIPYRLTMDNNQSNLIPLCRKCHIKVENLTREVLTTEKDYALLKFIMCNILNTLKQARMVRCKIPVPARL